jgi:hypothetical protein
VGAGQTGGWGYFLEDGEDYSLDGRINSDVVMQPVNAIGAAQLKTLIEAHLEATGSKKAQTILDDWDAYLPKFKQVYPMSEAGAPEVSRVRVAAQQAIRIGEAPGWRLAGAFDWRLPGDPIRVDSPFELFLQRGARGESWRLARPSGSPDGSTQAWITDPLPIPG